MKRIYIFVLVSFFFISSANSSQSGNTAAFFSPFNSYSNNKFVRDMNNEVALSIEPNFKKYYQSIKIKPSLFTTTNLNKFVVIPLIGDKFRTSNFAFIVHSIKEVMHSLSAEYTIKRAINEKVKGEFYYGDVMEFLLTNQVNGLLKVEGKIANKIAIKSFIDHDGYCSYRRYYPVFNPKNEVSQELEMALLVIGKYEANKIEISNIKEKGIYGLSFWTADLDGDSIPDLLWGLDPGVHYNAYYTMYLSAYNLNGKWVPWILKDSSYWDSGC